MKFWIAKWDSYRPCKYGTISIHKTKEGANRAAKDYMANLTRQYQYADVSLQKDDPYSATGIFDGFGGSACLGASVSEVTVAAIATDPDIKVGNLRDLLTKLGVRATGRGKKGLVEALHNWDKSQRDVGKENYFPSGTSGVKRVNTEFPAPLGKKVQRTEN
uniref:Uncharacterized protein n=1 Tax=Chromera velia CCMP2878 TaxID=1169474 RepID=A0A0G4FMC2_9ALVE|mmetsp:Transcript_3111/g.6392  ORF Transcript_3111/g.6392 Transcript_3111/m.6392 type:complete len:161 (-) Transcript_3111:525-1007(-)|eukprot:Cvel_17749.t1-p1 / transcript=Cvel_17749.t1 / gene=Cvel_17749 / organism=Chromera_velia_CCMP2878 / gene_product=hypothetical protein / transcript_product=hypothetical protein / location=Cvel_scaffold1434:22041-22520(+) / protein_length=160 / sequence_SO=supercontig / SO=protein_coding / is_pseudo=false